MDKIHIEIITTTTADDITELKRICPSFLAENNAQPGSVISYLPPKSVLALTGIKQIIVNECSGFSGNIDFSSNLINWHIYRLNSLGPQSENIQDANGDAVNLAVDYILPCSDLHTLWENLIYDHNIKDNLLDYAEAIMIFSQKGVNFNIISCNKVMLLHGPPGTGKTSLCKALAQKLSIRLAKSYPKSILIEINSHNLFSKWFSESGKLVAKIFDHIRDVCEVPDTLVCVLIDEVESLAHAREQCMNGNEPSDAFKVVNAVLTQIDNLKRYQNVLVLTTSNIMRAIDVAFVDRADFKQYIGPPSVNAIKKIYKSCIDELLRTGIISSNKNQDYDEKLTEISEASLKLSGRMLRKLPLLACSQNAQNDYIPMDSFMESMRLAIDREFAERGILLDCVAPKLVNGY